VFKSKRKIENEEMDEKLKTQTFRFTNQFKTGEQENNDQVLNQDTSMIDMVPDESDEDSIEEEICASHASINSR